MIRSHRLNGKHILWNTISGPAPDGPKEQRPPVSATSCPLSRRNIRSRGSYAVLYYTVC
jgi:hypothetical protein